MSRFALHIYKAAYIRQKATLNIETRYYPEEHFQFYKHLCRYIDKSILVLCLTYPCELRAEALFDLVNCFQIRLCYILVPGAILCLSMCDLLVDTRH